MAAVKPDRLERNGGAYEAGIVIDVWYDRQKNLADGLHEKPW